MKIVRMLWAAIGLICLAACGGDEHGNDLPYAVSPAPGTYSNLQLLNNSPDAPPIDVLLDGAPFVTHLDYAQGTGEISISPGAHKLQVQIETPGAPTTVIGPTTLNATANMDYVVAIQGCVAGLPPALSTVRLVNCPSTPPTALSLMITSHELTVVPAESTQVQVINSYALNSAFNSGTASVYVSATADFSSGTLIGTVPPEGSLGPLQVSAGILTLSTQFHGLLFPEVRQLPIASGTDLIVSVLPGIYLVQVGYGPYELLCCAIQASSVEANGVNISTDSGYVAVRGINVSPDATALSLLEDTDLAMTPYYQQVVPASAASEPGVYRSTFAIVMAGNPTEVLASQTAVLRSSLYKGNSLWALGPLAHIKLLVTEDDYRPYATQARWRFVQGVWAAQAVDVYLTAPGAGIANTTPTYRNVQFATDTGNASFVAGTYDLTVTEAGSKTPIIGPSTISLTLGANSTMALREAPGGGPPYEFESF